MPIVGVLDRQRWITAGSSAADFVGLRRGPASWMADLTLDISQWSLLWPIILSGSRHGLGVRAAGHHHGGTLRNEQIGNASGLFNLLRNVGGSVGISVADTLVARRQQVHRSELARYLAPTSFVHQVLFRIQSYMLLHTGPRLAKLRAYAILQGALDQQSVLYSYVDDFRYMVLISALCLPLVFLFRPVKAKRGAPPAAD